jgi:hypothetical protein
MSSICSQLLPAYQAWKAALQDMQAALLEFQKTASQEAKKQFETAREKATQAREAYYHLAYETTTLYNEENICLIDALVIKTIDQSLKQGGGDKARLKLSPEGRIIECDLSNNPSTTITDSLAMIHDLTALQELICPYNENLDKLPKLPDGLKALYCYNTQIHELPKLPDGLRVLDCFNTQISELPKLPDGLRVLDCFNTPAAENPEVRRRLEEFQKNHPGVAIHY